MELHLFRHGQTNWNEERRAQGQSESELTNLGKEQATALGDRISEIKFDRVFCSSSVRTRQTAAHAFGETEPAIQYLDEFREIHLGPWEGTLYDEISVSDPESYDHFWTQPHLFNVSGAETFYQLQSRAVGAVENILRQHAEQRVAVVSHGALIKSLLCHFADKPISALWEPPNMHNCAHSIISLRSDGSGDIIQYADETTA